MAERAIAAVLKTARGKPLVGSNPTPSATGSPFGEEGRRRVPAEMRGSGYGTRNLQITVTGPAAIGLGLDRGGKAP